MRRFISLLVLAGIAVLARQQPVGAQATPPDSGFRLRVGGDISVLADEHEGAVLVVRGDATIRGDVGAVIVMDGDALIDGGRVGDLTVVRGHADLRGGAVVRGDVHLLDAKLTRSVDSRVNGQIDESVGPRVAKRLLTGLALIGVGLLAALVCAGVMGSLIAPDGLRETAQRIGTETWHVVSMSVALWVAGPLVAVLLLPTLVGLPFGLGYLVFVLPVLGFLGLIVAGAWLGRLMMAAVRRSHDDTAPSLPAATSVGIVTLVLVGRIPVLGFAATLLAMAGAGSVVLTAARGMRRNASRGSPASGPIRTGEAQRA